MNTKETEAKEKEILISKIQEINKKKRHKVRLRQYTYVKGNSYYYTQGFNLLQKQWDSAEYEQLKRMSLQGVKEVWERIPNREKPRPPIIGKTKEEKEKQNEDAFKILNKIIPRINNHNP